jgi:hypothetical protein
MSQPSLLPPLRGTLLAVVVTATLVVVLASAASAGAAGGSKHLSAQGWRTYHAYELLGADVDALHPGKAHAQLRQLMPRCSRLPGRGTQSTGVRAICKHAYRLLDRFVVAQLCGKGGGGQTAIGLCLISSLPAIDRDFDGGARASGTVASTLAPGRCRRAFARQQETWSAAATSGGALLDAITAGDKNDVDSAMNRWGDAFEKALDAPVGQGDAGCRPRI